YRGRRRCGARIDRSGAAGARRRNDRTGEGAQDSALRRERGRARLLPQEPSGRWSGMDADFCRAVAAAALSDVDKVSFVPLRLLRARPLASLSVIEIPVGRAFHTTFVHYE